METKYTSDGKKVIIVGKLNAQQTIVQEIFVQDGNEIPSGENFVVNSLHDKPSVSWKEKNIIELEANYQSKKIELDRLLLEADSKIRTQKSKTSEYLKCLIKHMNVKYSDFERLIDFMSGDLEYIVFSDYSTIRIEKLIDAIHKKEYSPKMISVFGRNDEHFKFDYVMNEYRDGSGSSHFIFPVKTFEEAKLKAIEILESKTKAGIINQSLLDFAKTIKYKFSKERMKEHKEAFNKCSLDQIANYEKNIQNLRDKLIK